jgi:hypothetical protein
MDKLERVSGTLYLVVEFMGSTPFYSRTLGLYRKYPDAEARIFELEDESKNSATFGVIPMDVRG